MHLTVLASWRARTLQPARVPLAALALVIGLYPKPIFDMIDAPIDRLVHEQMIPSLVEAGVESIDFPAPAEAEMVADGALGAAADDAGGGE